MTAVAEPRTALAVLRDRPPTLPRTRLVPAPPPARRTVVTTPPHRRPPTVEERLEVLRVRDHAFVAGMEEERGAAPEADPRLVARRLATACVEVVLGVRPAAQLARWLTPGVLDALRSRSGFGRGTVPGPRRAPACRGLRVCLVGEHAVEATAVVDDGRRVRAVAVRLETHRGAWRATAVEVG